MNIDRPHFRLTTVVLCTVTVYMKIFRSGNHVLIFHFHLTDLSHAEVLEFIIILGVGTFMNSIPMGKTFCGLCK